MADLFEQSVIAQPLAARLRPQALDQVIGQTHLLGPQGPLTQMLAQQHLPSIIFWGPPGVGKTTLARLLSQHVDAEMLTLSAVIGSGTANTIWIIGALSWPLACRLVRARVLSIREADFVAAARVMGAGDLYIIARHCIPNTTDKRQILKAKASP